MNWMRRIPESEFDAYAHRLLDDLAENIRTSGVPIKAIARGARVKWDTVYAALKGRPIRVYSASRIIYFIREYKAAQAADTTVNINEENEN